MDCITCITAATFHYLSSSPLFIGGVTVTMVDFSFIPNHYLDTSNADVQIRQSVPTNNGPNPLVRLVRGKRGFRCPTLANVYLFV